jgi:hypothetical protein
MRLKLGGRLRRRNARFQSCEHTQRSTRTFPRFVQRLWKQHVRASQGRHLEAFWQDANNSRRGAIDGERASHHIRIARKPAAP